MGMIQDFKDFAFKGNLIDMAVGIVMGTAVAAIVKSFLDNIILPLVASIAKVGDMSKVMAIPLGEGEDAAVMAIGSFIEEAINFTILAFVIFLALKIASTWMKKAEEDAEPSDEVKLLTEIRDSLAKS